MACDGYSCSALMGNWNEELERLLADEDEIRAGKDKK